MIGPQIRTSNVLKNRRIRMHKHKCSKIFSAVVLDSKICFAVHKSWVLVKRDMFTNSGLFDKKL